MRSRVINIQLDGWVSGWMDGYGVWAQGPDLGLNRSFECEVKLVRCCMFRL